jgi:hypothetical protein
MFFNHPQAYLHAYLTGLRVLRRGSTPVDTFGVIQ